VTVRQEEDMVGLVWFGLLEGKGKKIKDEGKARPTRGISPVV
jgi:hypothetical protein